MALNFISRKSLFKAAILPFCLLFCGCGSESGSSGTDESKSILFKGPNIVHYGQLPADSLMLASDLVVGVAEGKNEYMFGDIRGIEADDAGNIYVFDYQASNIRVFSSEGNFLGIIANGGQGPQEITAANGMVLKGDTILWIHDYGQNQMKGLSKKGELLTSFPPHVRSRSPIFSGVIDDNGVYWKQSLRYLPGLMNAQGLVEAADEVMMIGFDPISEKLDTVSMGMRAVGKTYRVKTQRGFKNYGIPFQARNIARIHPKGGFWIAGTDKYEIARLDLIGDSLFVIKVDIEPQRVTTKDKRALIDRMAAESLEEGVIGEEIAALIPVFKPLIQDLIVDDTDRLWVQRQSETDQPFRYDVFDDEGGFVKSVFLSFNLSLYSPIRHRNGRIYGLNLDSLSVPIVVRSAQFSF